MGQPISSCAWREPGACSACHRDHPADRRRPAHCTELDAGLARDTGILSRVCRQKAEYAAETHVVRHLPEDNGTENQSSYLIPITLRGWGGGSVADRRQVMQIAGLRSAGRERRVQSGRPGLYAGFWRGTGKPDDSSRNSEGQVSSSDTVTGTQAGTSTDPKAPPGPSTGRTRDGAAQVVRIIRF